VGRAAGSSSRELVRNPQLRLQPVGFVDDDPRKRGTKDEHGLKVLGTTSSEDLTRILDEVEPDEVVIAVPSAPGTLRGRVVMACRTRGIPVRTTPTVFELLRDGSGDLRVTRQLREVQVEDVLGRDPVQLDPEEIGGYEPARARRRVRGIGDVVRLILDEAERLGTTPLAAAMDIARRRLPAGGPEAWPRFEPGEI